MGTIEKSVKVKGEFWAESITQHLMPCCQELNGKRKRGISRIGQLPGFYIGGCKVRAWIISWTGHEGSNADNRVHWRWTYKSDTVDWKLKAGNRIELNRWCEMGINDRRRTTNLIVLNYMKRLKARIFSTEPLDHFVVLFPCLQQIGRASCRERVF